MKKIFTIIVLFVSSLAYAQEIEWQNSIGGSGDDFLSSVLQTTDGGYILSGWSGSNISGDKTENCYGAYDCWIVKIDAIGNIEWQNTIGGNDNDDLIKVIETDDGGFLLGALSESNISVDKTENSKGGVDYWILKIDSVGNIIWQHTIGGAGDDELTTIIQTSDGGYFLGGRSESNISGDKTENSYGIYDYWVVKTDSLGDILWQKTIGGDGEEEIYSILPTFDGGYLLGGHSRSNISGIKTENCIGNYDYWIVKIDGAGAVLWQNTIGGNNMDRLFSLTQMTDGGFLLGGYSLSNSSGDKTENSIGDADYWIVKTDSIGYIEWQNIFGGSTTDFMQSSVIQTNDKGFLLSGYSNSNISGNKTENSQGERDFWIIQIDSIGRIQWQNSIGGSAADVLGSIVQSTNGGYLLGGWSGSNISGDKTENSNGQYDYWIVKITGNYNLIQGKTYADLNSNQLQEPGDPAIPYLKVTESTTNRFTFSQASGFYSVAVLDTGNFEVAPDYVNLYNSVPLVHSGNFTAIQQIDSLNDFAFQPTGTFNDLCLTITPTSQFRSGFNASYMLSYSNQGTTSLIPTIVFYPDTNVSFVSASITPTTITQDSVVFVLSSLSPFQSGQISTTVSVDLGVPIGTLINSGAMILPIANDANPGCNSSYWEVFTTGSFDPNDILVNRSFIYDYEMAAPPDLEYIIRFQNTGNDTAFTVKILNPLDTTRLDLNSLDIVATSHNADIRFVYHERNLEFVMNNILLPDSNTNEEMSHGFVRYRIKPKTTVAVGDSIQNFAAIYFDFNAPVITNTAVTHIIVPTGISQPTASGTRPTIFPNPVNDQINVEWNNVTNQKVTIELYNIYGQKVRVLFSENVDSGKWSRKFDVSDLSQGVYFIKFSSGIGFKVIKL